MPLTEKGKKLKAKFRGQYGKKKGDSIFYAMENSGKLKKVLKAQAGGGADASKKDYKTPGSAAYSRSYNPGAGGVVQHGGGPNIGGGNVSGGGTKKPFKNPFINEQGKFNVIGPVTAGLRLVQEIFTPKQKKHPFSANTIKQTRPKQIMGNDDRGPQLCPDGTLPPCKVETTKATAPTQPTNTFLKDFKAYNSGGVSSGPPPKRGPNPQVPPIKMRNGKMTNKYKMSCPHRPDGIRGMGAAIKGHKFIGVK
jgi:hypothetical protein